MAFSFPFKLGGPDPLRDFNDRKRQDGIFRQVKSETNLELRPNSIRISVGSATTIISGKR